MASNEIVKAAWMSFPVENGYRAREDRGVIRALRTWEGMVDQDDLKVSVTSPASMQTIVAPGRVIVDGDQDPTAQGSYIVLPPDEKAVTHDPADGVNPRWDVVGVQIWDDDFDGSGLLDWDRVIMKGVPAQNPVVPDGPGTAAWYPLAEVWVGAGVGSITPDNVHDVRNRTGHKPFICELVESVHQTNIPTGPGGAAKIGFDAIQQDPSGMWDAANLRVTVKVDGTYMIVGHATRNPDSAGNWMAAEVWVTRPNQAQVLFNRDYGPTPARADLSGEKTATWCGFLQAGTIVECYVRSDQPQPQLTSHSPTSSFLVVELLD